MYKVVAFDVDGTTVDTHFLINAIRDAYRDVRGYEVDESICDRMYGSPGSHAQMILEFSDDEMIIFNRQFGAHLPKYVHAQCLYDGIKDCMEALRDMGVIVAINTSRTVEGAHDASKALEWDFAGYADYVIGCDLVEKPKPAPDSLYKLKELCACELSEILFVGDTEFDSGCAINAGVDFALATWGTNVAHPAQYRPKNPRDIIDIVKDSMK